MINEADTLLARLRESTRHYLEDLADARRNGIAPVTLGGPFLGLPDFSDEADVNGDFIERIRAIPWQSEKVSAMPGEKLATIDSLVVTAREHMSLRFLGRRSTWRLWCARKALALRVQSLQCLHSSSTFKDIAVHDYAVNICNQLAQVVSDLNTVLAQAESMTHVTPEFVALSADLNRQAQEAAQAAAGLPVTVVLG
jgi:hypothetical protein